MKFNVFTISITSNLFRDKKIVLLLIVAYPSLISQNQIHLLIHDLLRRLKKNPTFHRYMVEVYTKSGVNTEAAKKYIFEKTGMVPAIYDKGTHYVTNHKLTFGMLKEISDSDDVLEVAGDYTGNITARGSSHVHSDDCPLQNLVFICNAV